MLALPRTTVQILNHKSSSREHHSTQKDEKDALNVADGERPRSVRLGAQDREGKMHLCPFLDQPCASHGVDSESSEDV